MAAMRPSMAPCSVSTVPSFLRHPQEVPDVTHDISAEEEIRICPLKLRRLRPSSQNDLGKEEADGSLLCGGSFVRWLRSVRASIRVVNMETGCA